MSLSHALSLSRFGFHVFPLVPNTKFPAIDNFPNLATRDEEKIKMWWLDPVLGLEQPYNVGISTSKFQDDEALLVVDIDQKGEKDGKQTIIQLESEGREFPISFEQHTPTGGRHILYRVAEAVKQGSDVLGRGVDIRSRGGYIVGAGSVTEHGVYTQVERHITRAPDWLIAYCGRPGERADGNSSSLPPQKSGDISSLNADRATDYLVNHAPLAIEGASGDQTTFSVAARVKDFGVDEMTCLELMFEHWNERCLPPWKINELKRKIENAYAYGQNPVGVDDPKNHFKEVKVEKALHPFEKLNSHYAYAVIKGQDCILHETKNHKGAFALEHMDIAAFHRKLAAFTMNFGGKSVPVSTLWIKSSERRSYDGLCFAPGQIVSPRVYNLWRGFTVEPLDRVATRQEKDSLDAFLEHARENICVGDEALYNWLITYFAHLVQKPWEKPLVALVFKGRKGSGKNALIERVGSLFGDSFAVVSNKRYLTGNFNSILENKVLLVLDEAFWSGDKAAEGVMKDLITGEFHRIERKGKEPYPVQNCIRLAILGNEEWLIPATEDERRFAVFNVGENRLQDRKFFREMREGMEAGGYRLLLKFLQEWDLSRADVTLAPQTEGLSQQKDRTLQPLFQWWKDCLSAGCILGASATDFMHNWPSTIPTDTLRGAFYAYCRERNISGWRMSATDFGKEVKRRGPSLQIVQRREGERRVQCYRLQSLAVARAEWDQTGNQVTKWEVYEDEEVEELFA